MPPSPARPSFLASLADFAWRRWGDGGRQDAGASTLHAPPPPPAQGARADAAAARTDCGPGGCGPAPVGGLAGPDFTVPFYNTVGLNMATVDVLCREQLLYTIVAALVDDGCQDRPTLAGRTGELTDCVEWLARRGWFEAQKQALFYSRQYGGGGVVCFVDDGRPPEEEVDVMAVRDVLGFYALPKWYLVPADAGSDRIRAGWYGGRIGRPERYWMTPVVPPNLGTAGAADEMLAKGGRLYHRSRVVPWPYRSDLDLRQARRFANWAGWGPGVVEGCIDAYLARRAGAMRTVDILQSSHFNVLTTPNVAHAQTTPDGGGAFFNAIEWIKWCLAATTAGGALPFTVVDPLSSLEAKSHSLAGIAEVLREERRFLLDNLPEYTEVRLFGSSSSGLSGDGKEGEWRAYYNNVSAYQRNVVWSAGTFGGGLRQAVCLAMLSRSGPTGGELDLTVEPTWPNLWTESAEATARTRKMNAEARAVDRVTLGLTPAAMLRHDATLAGTPTATYASLDVDDSPMPVLASQGAPGLSSPTALDGPGVAGGGGKPVAASTPASALSAIAGEGEGKEAVLDEAPPPPPALPTDISTEVDLARTLGMSRGTFRKWALARGVKVYPVDKGTRGGHRYSLGEVLKAWESSARSKMDALRSATTGPVPPGVAELVVGLTRRPSE